MKITKGHTLFVGFLLLSIALLAYFFNDHIRYKQEEIVQKRLDSYLQELHDKLKDRKNIVLTAAMLLSKDTSVKKCLQQDRKEACIEHLKTIQESFNSVAFSKNTMIHVHTADFRSFFRVWDLQNRHNDLLASFRESLQAVKKHKKEASGIEIGRFSMLIRGISPVLDDNKYLGSIEVISDFQNTTEYFKKRGINFYVLMDKKYEHIVKKVDYPASQRAGKYILVNDVNSDLNIFRDINLKGTGYMKKAGHYILYTPIYSMSNDKVGFYVLKILPSKLF